MWHGAFETNVQQHIVTLLLLLSLTLMSQVLICQHPLTRASTKLTIQSNPFCRHFPKENMGSDLLQCRSVYSVWLDWILSVRGLCVLVLHEIWSLKLLPPVVRCQSLRPKCTNFDFGWGSAPDPTRGAYSAPPNPLAGFRGPTSKGEGKGKRRRRGERGEDMGGEVWTPPKFCWNDATVDFRIFLSIS